MGTITQRAPGPPRTEAEWAWVAGLFEGEGTIGFSGIESASVKVSSTDRDVIETLHGMFPVHGGIKTLLPGTSDLSFRATRPQHSWRLGKKAEVETFLEGVLPWLHSRRSARATEALARTKRNRGVGVNHTRRSGKRSAAP